MRSEANTYVCAALASVALPMFASAFGILPSSTCHRIGVSPLPIVPLRLMAKKGDGKSKGMEEAFRQLEELKSLSLDEFPMPERKKQQDEAFTKAMQELDLKDIVEDPPEPSVESEAQLYKDMALELSATIETDLIDNVKTDLGGTTSSIPKFDPALRETDKFMEKALDQALEEAEKKAKMEIKKESLLDNKEIMKELMEGLQEMREEQVGAR